MACWRLLQLVYEVAYTNNGVENWTWTNWATWVSSLHSTQAGLSKDRSSCNKYFSFRFCEHAFIARALLAREPICPPKTSLDFFHSPWLCDLPLYPSPSILSCFLVHLWCYFFSVPRRRTFVIQCLCRLLFFLWCWKLATRLHCTQVSIVNSFQRYFVWPRLALKASPPQSTQSVGLLTT